MLHENPCNIYFFSGLSDPWRRGAKNKPSWRPLVFNRISSIFDCISLVFDHISSVFDRISFVLDRISSVFDR